MLNLAPTRTVTGRVLLEPMLEANTHPPRAFVFLMLPGGEIQEIEVVGSLAHDVMFVEEGSLLTVVYEDREPFARARSLSPAITAAA